MWWWWWQRELQCSAYLRYVDDFALFADSKAQLQTWRKRIIERLADMRLSAHSTEAQIAPCNTGIPWLGFIIFPTHRQLKRRNVVHFTQRLEHNIDAYESGLISFAELDASVQGWINHVRYADSWGLRGHIFDSHPIQYRPENSKIDSPDGER
jgi:RNA-directed DNA polymerase